MLTISEKSVTHCIMRQQCQYEVIGNFTNKFFWHDVAVLSQANEFSCSKEISLLLRKLCFEDIVSPMANKVSLVCFYCNVVCIWTGLEVQFKLFKHVYPVAVAGETHNERWVSLVQSNGGVQRILWWSEFWDVVQRDGTDSMISVLQCDTNQW